MSDEKKDNIFNKVLNYSHAKMDDLINKAKGMSDTNIDRVSIDFDPWYRGEELGYSRKATRINYATLRQMANKNSIVMSILATRINQVASFSRRQKNKYDIGFIIKPKEDNQEITEENSKEIESLYNFIENTGNLDNRLEEDKMGFEEFLRRIVRDRLTYDQTAIEKVRDRQGKLVYFAPIDGSTMRLATKKYGSVENNKFLSSYDPKKEDREQDTEYRYVQVINETIMRAFTQNDVILRFANVTNDIEAKGYSISELELLVNMITSHLNAESYNKKFFTQGHVTKGILHFKANISQRKLNMFKQAWYAQTTGNFNCLSGNTNIFTDNGIFTIDNILGQEKEKKIVVWTGTSWKDANVYRTGDKEKCSITLANGITVESSPDHRFKVIGEDGEPCWKVQSELDVGDYVAVNSKTIESGIQIPMYKGKVITPELMEFLGWITCDGYIKSEGKYNYLRAFYHHSKELDIRERHLSILKEFDDAAKIEDTEITDEECEQIKEKYGFKNVSNVRCNIVLYSCDFVKWLISLGFKPSKEGKVIPSFIFVLPEEYKCSFLRGMFSADGNNAKGRSPVITISDDIKREQTKLLLLSLGIRTTLSEGKTKNVIDGQHRTKKQSKFLLRIKDRDRFFEKISFLQEYKQSKKLLKENESNKLDRLPTSTIVKYTKVIRKFYLGKGIPKNEINQINAIICGIDGCSRPRLIRLLEKAGLEIPSWMTQYHFEPIVNVERTKEVIPMFDLEVFDDEHQFIANGVACHNSWRTPILAGMEEVKWIPLSQTQRDLEFHLWMDYCIKIICGVFLIDPSEINFDISQSRSEGSPMFTSKNEHKVKQSKDRGLRPLLRFIEDIINDILSEVTDKYIFMFVGLDEDSRREDNERYKLEIETYRSINEIRTENGLEPIKLSFTVGDKVIEPYDIPLSPHAMQLLTLLIQQAARGGGALQGEQALQDQVEYQPDDEMEDFNGLDEDQELGKSKKIKVEYFTVR